MKKIRNRCLSLGILYAFVCGMMEASHVEAQTACELSCAAVCEALVPKMMSQEQLVGELNVISLYLAQSGNSTFINNVENLSNSVKTGLQSFYSSLLGSYPTDVTALCGTTQGQTNCATVCAPPNVGQKAAPQVRAPASKAAPAKK